MGRLGAETTGTEPSDNGVRGNTDNGIFLRRYSKGRTETYGGDGTYVLFSLLTRRRARTGDSDVKEKH